MYLVILCRTMSAPRRSGDWKKGERKVLSTSTRGREGCECARAAMRGMSTRRSVGFVGVSIHTNYRHLLAGPYAMNRGVHTLVFSRNAARIAASSAPSRSTKLVCVPCVSAATRAM
jgi:hypothetical protein